MKPSDDACLQKERLIQETDEVLVKAAQADERQEGHWPAGQHGPLHDEGFDRALQGAPRADDRSSYTGQSAYGSLDKPATPNEHDAAEKSRVGAGQRGDFGEGSYGGERGESARGGMSSYGNSSGSRYSVDNEKNTMTRTATPLSQEGYAPGAAKLSTDGGQYANEYDAAAVPFRDDATVDAKDVPSRASDGVSQPTSVRSDDTLREEIHARLSEHPHLELRDLSVSVQGGHVRLEGSVPERRTRELIEDVVDNVNGVINTENLIEVQRREDAVSTFASGYTAGQAYAAAHDVTGGPNHTGAATFGVATAKAAADKKASEANKPTDKTDGGA